MRIRAEPSFWILCAFVLLYVPLDWSCAILIAAVIHELSHLAIICLQGGRIIGISVGIRGTVIHTSPMEPKEEVLSAIAGPLGSFLLLLFARIAPRVAMAALVQGLFNLLPLYQLDGGRVLHCVMEMASSEQTAFRACMIAEWTVCIVLMILAIICRVGVVIPVFITARLLRPCFEKLLAKKGK